MMTSDRNHVNGNGTGNGLSFSDQNNAGTMSLATTRQAEEVKAAIFLAKQFPRDEIACMQRILKSCQRRGLAECAMYTYPKGGTNVHGPSIRLAEAMAQAWGNIDYGVIELEQKHGESVCMSYAWDLETNTRRQMVFTVAHKVHRREAPARLLTDPRDIYEQVANLGARRVRACILGIIPGDVQDAAIAQVTRTLSEGNTKPLQDRIRDMVIAFGELGVTQKMLEKRLGHKITACNEQELVNLKGVARSLRDGMAQREQYFDISADEPAQKPTGSRTQQVAERMKNQRQPESEAATKETTDGPPTDDDIRNGEAGMSSGDTDDDYPF